MVDAAADAAQVAGGAAGSEAADAADAAAKQISDDLVEAGPVSDRRELVFIDAAVGDVETLMADIDPNAEVIFLDADRDGVEQIAEAVQSRSNIDAIHILAHGDEGSLSLGNTELTAASILGEHGDDLSAIGEALSVDGDILIYGCDFTGGEVGIETAALLASATGADIAASEDLTGSAALGGDWQLETTIGTLETEAIRAENWNDVLIDATVDIQVQAVDATESQYTEDGDVYTFGNGQDLEVTGVTTESGINVSIADVANRVEIRTIDNDEFAGDPRTRIFVQNAGGSGGSGDINTVGSLPGAPGAVSLEEALGGTIINRGVLDVFNNTNRGVELGSNIERVDFIFDNGITAPTDADLLDEAGHLYLEKNANNNGQLAAILSLDADGNPASFGELVSTSGSDLEDATINGVGNAAGGSEFRFGFHFLNDVDPIGTDPTTGGDIFEGGANPVRTAGSNEAIGGALITLEDLGIAAGQTYFGVAYFDGAFDNDDVADGTFNPVTLAGADTNTGNNNGGADFVGGIGGVFFSSAALAATPLVVQDDSFVVVPNTPATISPLGNDQSGLSITSIIDIDDPSNPLPISSGETVELNSGTKVTLNGDGTLTVEQPLGADGFELFDYTVTDGSRTGQATITLETDTDADGVANVVDIDDDNDGIIDHLEFEVFEVGDLFVPAGLSTGDDITAATQTPGGVPGFATTSDNAFTLRTELQGTATYASGVDLVEGFGLDEVIQFQPDNTDFVSGSVAVYTIEFDQFVEDLTFTVGGLNFDDATQIQVFNGDKELTVDASNFSGVDTSGGDLEFVDADGNTVASSNIVRGPVTSGGLDPTINDFVFSIDGPVTEIRITSAKFPDSGTVSGTVTIGIHSIGFKTPLDSDSDGVSDHLDIDKDNDGITDNVEAQATGAYIPPSGQGAGITDSDSDGLDDNYDADTGSADRALSLGLDPVDTDLDGTDDVLDADSDNDTIADVAERGDGAPTATPPAPFNDADGDGLLDEFEGADSADGFDVNDENIAGDDGGDIPGDADYTNFNLSDSDNDTDADDPVAGRTTNDAVGLSADLDFRDADAAPVAVDDAESYALNTALTGIDLLGDDDPGNGIASVTLDPGSLPDPASEGVFTVTDAGGSVITIDALTGPIALSDFNDLTFTPVAGFRDDVAPVTYTITDIDGDSASATLTLTGPGNTAPAAVDDAETVAFDAGAVALGNVIAGVNASPDSDPEGDALTVVAVDGAAGDVGAAVAGSGGGVFTIASDGTVSFDTNGAFDGLAPGASATSTVSYTISDGFGGTDQAIVTVTVTGPIVPNAVPILLDDVIETPFGTPVDLDVLENDIALGEGVDTVVLDGLPDPAQGTFFITDGSGDQVPVLAGQPLSEAEIQTLSFVPAPDFQGVVDPVTYTVTDLTGDTASATISVTVAEPIAPNEVPVLVDDAVETLFDTPVALDILDNDPDFGDGIDTVVIDLLPSAEQGTLFITDGSGDQVPVVAGQPLSEAEIRTLSFVPDPVFQGTVDPITYTVTDLSGDTASATISVTVGTSSPPPAIDPPVSALDDQLLARVPGWPFEQDLVTLPQEQESGFDRFAQAPNGFADLVETSPSHSFNFSASTPGSQHTVEFYTRSDVLFIEMKYLTANGAPDVGGLYSVTRADGGPMPAWLDDAGGGLLFGEPPASKPEIVLRMTLGHENEDERTVIVVRVNTATGEIFLISRDQGGPAEQAFLTGEVSEMAEETKKATAALIAALS
ncbi:MAG: DUF4347 domain-containing protein [Pseudomonadota bacterium]